MMRRGESVQHGTAAGLWSCRRYAEPCCASLAGCLPVPSPRQERCSMKIPVPCLVALSVALCACPAREAPVATAAPPATTARPPAVEAQSAVADAGVDALDGGGGPALASAAPATVLGDPAMLADYEALPAVCSRTPVELEVALASEACLIPKTGDAGEKAYSRSGNGRWKGEALRKTVRVAPAQLNRGDAFTVTVTLDNPNPHPVVIDFEVRCFPHHLEWKNPVTRGKRVQMWVVDGKGERLDWSYPRAAEMGMICTPDWSRIGLAPGGKAIAVWRFDGVRRIERYHGVPDPTAPRVSIIHRTVHEIGPLPSGVHRIEAYLPPTPGVRPPLAGFRPLGPARPRRVPIALPPATIVIATK